MDQMTAVANPSTVGVDHSGMESGQPPGASARRIILLSDGTGNSSGKLFKTNVWRIYEALDLGPGSDRTDQFAFYDDGVGNSSFKPLAILGGIFGLGLKRNVLNLYRFLCRNYVAASGDIPGSEIYAFGFSRGAFTIRLLVALIGSQGIVPYHDERDLDRQVRGAYREFCRTNRPNVIPWLVSIVRFIRDVSIAGLQRVTGVSAYRPGTSGQSVRFVGVWDTVAAYGGPIVEITRAIDDWIFPLTMTDYELGDHVQTARHALALDDERDAFQPLLWDEVHERRQSDAARAQAARTSGAERSRWLARAERYDIRLRQVWFAGMHSDVGGGYPDESLSYVSLLWMMEEVAETGLAFLSAQVDRICGLSNSFGPIHDSRRGIGAYYRYQPRKIEALLHRDAKGARPMHETAILRDPRVGEQKHRPQGLLLSCQVHESVIARIASGTDNYAPINLPRFFDVVNAGRPIPPHQHRVRSFDPAVVSCLGSVGDERAEIQETIWDWVFQRRATYFATVLVALLLVWMPSWLSDDMISPLETNGRWLLGSVVGWLRYILPEFATPWVDAFSRGSLYFVAIVSALSLLLALSTWQERVLRDRTRELWWAAISGAPLPGKSGSTLRTIRTSAFYQRPYQVLKWWLLPSVIGFSLLVGAVYACIVIVTQARLGTAELEDEACADAKSGGGAGLVFVTSSPCAYFGDVESGTTYHVIFDTDGRWTDGGIKAAPDGLKWNQTDIGQKAVFALLTPLKRVIGADYMQPIAAVRARDMRKGIRPVTLDRLRFEPDPRIGNRYSAVFKPKVSGRLALFVNDAVYPSWLPVGRRPSSWFYNGHVGMETETAQAMQNSRFISLANRGSARVNLTVE